MKRHSPVIEKLRLIDPAKIYDDYLMLGSAIKVKELYGVSHTYIIKILKENGYAIKPRGYCLQKSQLKMPHDPATLAYIAGMLDGEGCIPANHSSNKIYALLISNTYKPVIEYIQRAIGGGTIYLEKPKKTIKITYLPIAGQ